MSSRRFSWMAALAFLSIFALCACNRLKTEDPGNDTDPLLAEVRRYKLHFSDVAEMIEPRLDTEDSLQLLRSVTESWAREKILLLEAEKKIPPSLDIERLLDDYRTSILNHYYEKLLVETLLDTVVSDAQKEAYHSSNEDQFTLAEPILRCQLIEVENPAPRYSSLRQWWRQNDEAATDSLVAWCNTNAKAFIMDTDSWYSASTVLDMLPEPVIHNGNIQQRDQRRFEHAGHTYFFRLLDWKKKGQTAPVTYVVDEIEQAILQKRKLDLIQRTKQDLYERALDNGQVKINL